MNVSLECVCVVCDVLTSTRWCFTSFLERTTRSKKREVVLSKKREVVFNAGLGIVRTKEDSQEIRQSV